MTNGVTPRLYNGVTIQQWPDGYLHATAMCKAAGKDYHDYERLSSTRGFAGDPAAALKDRASPWCRIGRAVCAP